MDDEHNGPQLSSAPASAPLKGTVAPHPDGGWVALISLGDGASMTKWFADRDQAEGYEAELAEWLASRAE